MEYAHAQRQVAARFGAEAYRRGPRFHHARLFAGEGSGGVAAGVLGVEACRALPAWASAGASANIGEGVGAFGPVGLPQAGASRHRRLRDVVLRGKFADEARGDAAGP